MEQELRIGTVVTLRNKLKELNYTGKLDKVRKDDLIVEYLKIKQQEWI